MAKIVAGDTYYNLDGQLLEIKRQLRQPNGYPYDPEDLSVGLQKLIEGKFEKSVEVVEVSQQTPQQPLILTSTSPTFSEWLKTREEMHKFLTGETVILRDMYEEMNDELLARTD
ncbi:MAG: hypothetical protein Q8Q03_01625, partial [bacterium]|nr:hypothetical protein [bacterium]